VAVDAPTLILASASPRRQELLTHLGVPFEVRPADVDETLLPNEPPLTSARRLATAKAQAVAAPGLTVIGADTLVTLDGRPLGKPADADEARSMLRRLRGRPHEVVTGVAVAADGKLAVAHASTGVVMRRYADYEIEAYIATGDPLDKAGAYAIQATEFKPVQMWNGCYCNVVGLPLALTASLLVQAGYPLAPVTKPAFCTECRFWG